MRISFHGGSFHKEITEVIQMKKGNTILSFIEWMTHENKIK